MAVPELAHLDHRPWPLPRAPWVLRMCWRDLAFLHWPVDPEHLRPHVPGTLEVDTFDGTAWLGVVPFRMEGVRPRGTPALPGLSAFPEINLRTYVRHRDRPGVWFFSLDVTSRPCVVLARTFFHLPYNHAVMSMRSEGERIHYASDAHHDGGSFAFQGTYAPSGSEFLSRPGTLESWLTERYCLYSADRRNRVYRGEVHHVPWPLQPAEATVETNTLARGIPGVDLSGPPLAHVSRGVDVVAWWCERLS